MAAQKTRSVENNPRRWSRRIQGLAPSQIDVSSPKAVFLPPELKVAVLALLDRWDLKSVRLVSKEWSALATRPLFDRVFISCREKDLEVFKSITRHPVISEGVKELVFDASFFRRTMDLEEYIGRLADNISWPARLEGLDTPFDSTNSQLNEFYRHCQEDEVDLGKIYDIHKNDTFIVQGHQKYRDHSAFEYQCILNSSFAGDLVAGVESLSSLRSVVFSHETWKHNFFRSLYSNTPRPKTFQMSSSGSPLCRSWNPFHLRPWGWQRLPDIDDGRRRIVYLFHTLTWALHVTDKRVTSIQVSNRNKEGGLPQEALIRSDLSNVGLWRYRTANSYLRCLELHITTEYADHGDVLMFLPKLLMQARGLRQLSLLFTRGAYPYDQVFPAIGIWRELTELSLSGLAIRGWDLVLLVLSQARHLRRLYLSDIDLLQGTWEGVVEGMHHRPPSTDLTMRHSFTHCGGTIFKPSNQFRRFTDCNILRDIENYVLYGGRHPCLDPEFDTEIAWRWFVDLIPEEFLEDLRFSARELGQNLPALTRPD